MSFDPLREDPMDKVPSPPLWVVLSFVGCVVIFVLYLYLWSFLLS